MSENKDKLVVYKRFCTPQEAYVLNGLLDSEGIYAEVINDNLAYSGFGVGMTNISQAGLLVREEDIEKIDALLNAEFKAEDLAEE